MSSSAIYKEKAKMITENNTGRAKKTRIILKGKGRAAIMQKTVQREEE